MLALLIQDPARKLGHIENPAPARPVDAYGQLTKLASTFDHVDGLFYFTYAVCIFFFVVIVGVIVVSVVKYRRKTWDQPALSNVTHNTPLEVVWTVIPLIIVMVMFAWGFKGSLDMTTPPKAASLNSYKATARQWSWEFTMPNGETSLNAVWVEVGKPVQFHLESMDVLHAFFLPDMRVKRDVIPGRFQTVWFTPTEVGDFHLFCAEYCGEDHSKMYAQLHVVTAEQFALRPWDEWDKRTPVENGENLYKLRGCNSCHSLNGTALAGPSWKGLFVKNADGTIVGRQREVLVAGQKQTITVDEAYIAESIRTPMAKVVAELPFANNAMSAFDKMEDRQVAAIIEFMKSLAEAK